MIEETCRQWNALATKETAARPVLKDKRSHPVIMLLAFKKLTRKGPTIYFSNGKTRIQFALARWSAGQTGSSYGQR